MSDGRCLEHAYDDVMKLSYAGKKALYVQATVTNPATGKSFKHAWAETGQRVIDSTLNLDSSKKRYYEILNPKDIIRVEDFIMVMLGKQFYTKEQVKRTTDHFKELDKKYGKKKK